MEPAIQVVLSGALTFGVPLVLAIHQLFATGRAGDLPPGGNAPAPAKPPPLPNADFGHKPLPACLIPVLDPTLPARGGEKARALEPA